MTNLTEQWKKGELELDKNYYIELEDGTIEIQMFVGGFLCKEDNGVKEVLAPVPSYEEWKAKLEENTKLKEQCDNWYKSFEAKSKGLFETMKDCHSLVQLVLKLSPEHKGYLEKNYKEYL